MHISLHKNPREGRNGSIDFACGRGNCPKRFHNSNHLQNHLNIHDNVLYRCHFCGWTGVKTEHLNVVKHFNNHFRIRPYPCSLCNARFYDKTAQGRHEQAVHEKIRRVLKCGSCEFETLADRAYRRHIQTCDKRKLHVD